MIIYPIVPPVAVVPGVQGIDGVFEKKTPNDNGGLLNWDHEFPNIDKADNTLAPTYEKTVKTTEGP